MYFKYHNESIGHNRENAVKKDVANFVPYQSFHNKHTHYLSVLTFNK